MKRRKFLQTTVLASVVPLTRPAVSLAGSSGEAVSSNSVVPEFELDELTISELQAGMTSGKFTARSLVRKYTERMDDIDRSGPKINSVLEMNPEAAP